MTAITRPDISKIIEMTSRMDSLWREGLFTDDYVPEYTAMIESVKEYAHNASVDDVYAFADEMPPIQLRISVMNIANMRSMDDFWK